MNKKLITSLSAALVFGTVFAASFGISYALQIKAADNASFSIGSAPVVTTGFFANVYSSTGSLVSSNETIVNEDNTSELMIKDLSLSKGQSVKLFKKDGSVYYGTSSSYSHNLTVACSKNAGLLTETDNYIAVQNGTYDFYFKFSDNTYANYQSTYVNVDNVKTYYFQDTYNKGGSTFVMHYWGSNVIGTIWDYKPSLVNTGKQDSGHNMYRAVVPGQTTDYIIIYDGHQSADLTFANTFGSNNAVWFGNNYSFGGYYTFVE